MYINGEGSSLTPCGWQLLLRIDETSLCAEAQDFDAQTTKPCGVRWDGGQPQIRHIGSNMKVIILSIIQL